MDVFNEAVKEHVGRIGQRAAVSVFSGNKGEEGVVERLTFGELAEAVEMGSRSLESLGVQPGSAVAVLSSGCLEVWVVLLSLQQVGATPMLLPAGWPASTLAGLVGDASLLLVSAEYYATAEAMVVGSSTAPRLAALETTPPQGSTRVTFEQWTCFDASVVAEVAPKKVAPKKSGAQQETTVTFESPKKTQPNKVAVVVFGTESVHPVAVRYSYEELSWICSKSLAAGGLSLLPPHASVSVVGCFFSAILNGVEFFGASSVDDPDEALDALLALEPPLAFAPARAVAAWCGLAEDDAELRVATAETKTHIQMLISGSSVPEDQHLADRASALFLGGVRRVFAQEAVGIPVLVADGPLTPLRVADVFPAFTIDSQGTLAVEGYYGPFWSQLGVDVFGLENPEDRGSTAVEWLGRRDGCLVLGSGGIAPTQAIEALVQETLDASDDPMARDVTGIVCIGGGRDRPFVLVERSVADTTALESGEGGGDDDDPAFGGLSSSEEDDTERAWIAETLISTSLRGRALNARLPDLAAIGRENVVVLPRRSRLPRRGAALVDRAACERLFADELRAREARGQHSTAPSPSRTRRDLRVRAVDAGYDDLESFVAVEVEDALPSATEGEPVAPDSLGVLAASTAASTRMHRAADGIKAWAVTAVLAQHWYQPSLLRNFETGAGALDVFYQHSGYTKISWCVQFLCSVATLTGGLFADRGAGPAYAAVFFAAGLGDSARARAASALFGESSAPTSGTWKTKKRSKAAGNNDETTPAPLRLGWRDAALAALAAAYKFPGYGLMVRSYERGAVSGQRWASFPVNDVWVLYALFLYRLTTSLSTRVFGLGGAGLTTLALTLVLVANEIGLDYSPPAASNATVAAILAVVIDPTVAVLFPGDTLRGAFFPYEDDDDDDDDDHNAYVDLKVNGTPLVRVAGPGHSTSRPRLIDPRYLVFFVFWLVGYFWGPSLIRRVDEGRSRLRSSTRRHFATWPAALLLGLKASAGFALLNVAWAGDAWFKVPRRVDVDRPLWVATPPNWVWDQTNGPASLASWGPLFARPLYVAYDLASVATVVFFVVAFAAALPRSSRPRRLGRAGLGLLFFGQLCPTVVYAWLCASVAKLGAVFDSAGNAPTLKLLQLSLLLAWPVLFAYVFGPLLTALTSLIPGFWRWLLLFSRRGCSCSDLSDALRSLPRRFIRALLTDLDEIASDLRSCFDCGRRHPAVFQVDAVDETSSLLGPSSAVLYTSDL